MRRRLLIRWSQLRFLHGPPENQWISDPAFPPQRPISLPKLAVLASAPVVPTVMNCFLVLFRLTIDTQAHARDRLTAGGGDRGVTFFAVVRALAPWQLVTRAIDSVLDCRIDLVLYRPVFCKILQENSGQIRTLSLLITWSQVRFLHGPPEYKGFVPETVWQVSSPGRHRKQANSTEAEAPGHSNRVAAPHAQVARDPLA